MRKKSASIFSLIIKKTIISTASTAKTTCGSARYVTKSITFANGSEVWLWVKRSTDVSKEVTRVCKNPFGAEIILARKINRTNSMPQIVQRYLLSHMRSMNYGFFISIDDEACVEVVATVVLALTAYIESTGVEIIESTGRILA